MCVFTLCPNKRRSTSRVESNQELLAALLFKDVFFLCHLRIIAPELCMYRCIVYSCIYISSKYLEGRVGVPFPYSPTFTAYEAKAVKFKTPMLGPSIQCQAPQEIRDLLR